MPFDPAALPTRPLCILHVMPAFPKLSETFVSNEIRALRALGHRVVPLALSATEHPCQPEDEAFRAETLHLPRIPARDALLALAPRPDRLARAAAFAFAQAGIRPRSLLLAGARVALAARQAGCTHIHAHFAHAPAATAIVAARLAGATASFTGHGFDIYGAAKADLAAKLAAVDLAIAVCADMAADFRAIHPGARVALVPCGVDPARFRPNPSVTRNGRLLAVGRLAPQKGYEVLLAALAALPADRRPVVDAVGGGELALQLTSLARDLGVSDSIRFLGPRSSDWIAEEGPRYLGFVAPYVITADGDRDTGPIVVKEALAMGLPVLASALMGIKETVAPACGWLVPPGDVGALAAGFARIAALPEPARCLMGVAGRAHVQTHFSLAAQGSGFAAAIAALGQGARA
jgi:colanic acid/amylovoran biosynthesis glycosyltransferase